MDEIAVNVAESEEIAALADAVSQTRRERLLCRDGKVLARVVPEDGSAAPGVLREPPTEEDRAAFLSSAGGWAEIDTDALVERIYEDRRGSVHRPVEF